MSNLASAEQTTGRAAGKEGCPTITVDGAVRHYFDTLLQRLNWPGDDSSRLLRTLGVTSCHVGEGVSGVAAHLALAAATHRGQRVLLVDANGARPSVHGVFKVALSPGFAEAAADGVEPRIAVHDRAAGLLSVMAAGRFDDAADRVFDAENLSNLIVSLREHFDLIVFDLPPALHEDRAIQLAMLLDGVLLVVQSERVAGETAQRMADILRQAGVNLVGAVLNQQ